MSIKSALLLVLLAAIWGSSFVFMRASADAFGPIALIAVRISVAALVLIVFFKSKKRRDEFLRNWRILFFIGVVNSALPFSLLAYASLSLTGGTVSILNAMTPVFTAWVSHIWLKDSMNKLQFLGMAISISGLIFLVWDKVSFTIDSWLPVLAGVGATICYGFASTSTKKHLCNVSVMTSTAGSLLFSALLLLFLSSFFLPDFSLITPTNWLYAIILGVLCTAIAFIIYFKLVKDIGPAKTSTVTFLIPIFAFFWGFILLGEKVTFRMWMATLIILLGMSLVTGIIKPKKKLNKIG